MSLKEFKLPDLGEGLTESEIVAWRVEAGERVALNQIIADVETAKAVVELPSPFDGVVQRLHAEPGDTVDVGATIVTFELEGETPLAEERAEGGHLEAHPEEQVQPNLVGYGAGPESTGRPARKRRVDAQATPASAPGEAARPAERAETRHERPRSTPPVRYLAEQLGVDLETVTGTGPDGLITREDVQAASSGGAVSTRGSAAAQPAAGQPATGLERRVPIKGVRKFTAAAMVRSAFTAPTATVFLTVDVTPTMDLLARLSQRRELEGTRITLLALVARAFVIALRRHPELNSRWDEDAQEIVTYGNVNLGIAAATDRGLVVPHIPDAHAQTLLQLAESLGELTRAARAGTTPQDRLTGSTITISNPGIFGVDAGTPILNPGEAAILALGAVQTRPWEHEGELALRKVMTLSLSFDHRVIDGAEGSMFLATLGALLADPALAMLHDAGLSPLPLD